MLLRDLGTGIIIFYENQDEDFSEQLGSFLHRQTQVYEYTEIAKYRTHDVNN